MHLCLPLPLLPLPPAEKADVWSLGVVFWEMLTLEVPFADMPPAQLIGGEREGREGRGEHATNSLLPGQPCLLACLLLKMKTETDCLPASWSALPLQLGPASAPALT